MNRAVLMLLEPRQDSVVSCFYRLLIANVFSLAVSPLQAEPNPEAGLVDTLPGPQESTSVRYLACTSQIDKLLDKINAVRATGGKCASTFMVPARPLRVNSLLEHAAFEHSYNMATHNFLSHTGRDGSDVGQRVSSYGYEWRFVGENIGAGQPSVEKAVEEWLASPEHCQNLMSQEYTETGFACVANLKSEYRFYWVQVFATPFE